MNLLVLIVLAASPTPQAAIVDAEAQARIERFASRWERATAVTYTLKKSERLRNGRVIREELDVKLRKPKTLYVAQMKPRRGQEAIYDPGRDVEQLIAHPGHFPDFTVNLDVLGSYATKDQHHPVLHIGFAYTIGVVQRLLTQARERPCGERIEFVGTETVGGMALERVRIRGGKAPWKRVRARDDETVFAFADRVGIDPYVIYYNNPSIDDFTDELDDGSTYRVPPYYAPQLDLWFDPQTGMLRVMEARDYQQRLYERFEYLDMDLEPELTDRDFDPDNPEYDF